eukprot:733853-Pelagomonas_calceolata.AAC.3
MSSAFRAVIVVLVALRGGVRAGEAFWMRTAGTFCVHMGERVVAAFGASIAPMDPFAYASIVGQWMPMDFGLQAHIACRVRGGRGFTHAPK